MEPMVDMKWPFDWRRDFANANKSRPGLTSEKRMERLRLCGIILRKRRLAMYDNNIETRIRRLRNSSEFDELKVPLPRSVYKNVRAVCEKENCTLQSFVTEALDLLVEAFNETLG